MKHNLISSHEYLAHYLSISRIVREKRYLPMNAGIVYYYKHFIKLYKVT